MADVPLLEVANVSIRYGSAGSSYLALSNISFSVAKGEFVSIVGPSGCGKTSLLNAFAGLLSISNGILMLGGERITGPGRDRAVVFQNASLLPWRSVRRNISFGLEGLKNLNKAEIGERVTWAAELVGLTKFIDAFPYQLSGGMQQRANLARALVTRPEILLLDEPFASLDAETRSRLQSELERICLETSMTALFVTHDVLEAVALSNKVVVLSRGPARVLEIVDVPLGRPRLGSGIDLESLSPTVTTVRGLLLDAYDA